MQLAGPFAADAGVAPGGQFAGLSRNALTREERAALSVPEREIGAAEILRLVEIVFPPVDT